MMPDPNLLTFASSVFLYKVSIGCHIYDGLQVGTGCHTKILANKLVSLYLIRYLAGGDGHNHLKYVNRLEPGLNICTGLEYLRKANPLLKSLVGD